jgi:hypothetical protein
MTARVLDVPASAIYTRRVALGRLLLPFGAGPIACRRVAGSTQSHFSTIMSSLPARLHLDSQLSSLLVKSYMHYNLDSQESRGLRGYAHHLPWLLAEVEPLLGLAADPTGDVVARQSARLLPMGNLSL